MSIVGSLLPRNSTECSDLIAQYPSTSGNSSNSSSQLAEMKIAMWSFYLLLIFIGIATFAVSWLYRHLRQSFSKGSVDEAFDAGGQTSIWLNSVAIFSRQVWASGILYSATSTVKYGLLGNYSFGAFYLTGIVIFNVLAVGFRLRAPGAKTFLQMVRTRFGTSTHVTFVFFALLTNVIIIVVLLLSGSITLIALVDGIRIEMVALLLALVFGAFSVVGGLGGTFYVSWVSGLTIYAILAIFMIRTFVWNDESLPVGSPWKMYSMVQCSTGPEGSYDDTFFSVRSSKGIIYLIVLFFNSITLTTLDQANWQNMIAAKPKQGVIAFLIAVLLYLIVPLTSGTVFGMGYVSLSVASGSSALTQHEMERGMIVPWVAGALLGRTGQLLVIALIILSVVSAGSSQVMAISSILVYDFYQTYFRPFQSGNPAESCPLCKKRKHCGGELGDSNHELCDCDSHVNCAACREDDTARKSVARGKRSRYNCGTHGAYREYDRGLRGRRDWLIVIVSILTVPLAILLHTIEVQLGWVMVAISVLFSSSYVPFVLVIFWDKLTSLAVRVAIFVGLTVGTAVWLGVSSTYPGGLADFQKNTGNEYAVIFGIIASLCTSTFLSVVMSLMCKDRQERSSGAESTAWSLTREIGNPLKPWTETLRQELQLPKQSSNSPKPSLQHILKSFSSSRLAALVGSLVFIIVFNIIWPVVLYVVGTFSFATYSGWIIVHMVWISVAFIFSLLMPLIGEVLFLRNLQKTAGSHPDLLREIPSKNSYAAKVFRGIKNVSANDGEKEANANSAIFRGEVEQEENREGIIISNPPKDWKQQILMTMVHSFPPELTLNGDRPVGSVATSYSEKNGPPTKEEEVTVASMMVGDRKAKEDEDKIPVASVITQPIRKNEKREEVKNNPSLFSWLMSFVSKNKQAKQVGSTPIADDIGYEQIASVYNQNNYA